MELELDASLEDVWNIVINLQDYAWRSDISEIHCVDDSTFIEYANEGITTTFHITAKEPMKHYAFTLENKNMQGTWYGDFCGDHDHCRIRFVEEVEPKRLIMKPFVKGYLKKQQAQYAADLKKALENCKSA